MVAVSVCQTRGTLYYSLQAETVPVWLYYSDQEPLQVSVIIRRELLWAVLREYLTGALSVGRMGAHDILVVSDVDNPAVDEREKSLRIHQRTERGWAMLDIGMSAARAFAEQTFLLVPTGAEHVPIPDTIEAMTSE